MALYSKATVRAPSGGLAVELDPELAGDLKPGAPLDAISFGAEGLLLLREGASLPGYFAGSLLSISLPEVFHHIISGIRTGKLVVAFGAARKTISFRDGQITFATSTEPHERLGTALVRLGLVTPEERQAALEKVGPGHRLGQVLTASGRIKPSVLYGAMTFLVREITVDLFQMASGEFLFVEGAPGGEDVLRLPERTRDLVLEGVRRGEETAQLRARFRPGFRVRRGAAPSPERHSSALALLSRGPLELSALRAGFEGSDYAFLSWVDEALRSGELVEETPLPPREQAPAQREKRSTLELYAALVETICRALTRAGKDLSALRSFLEDPQPGMEVAFRGVKLSDEGALDVQRVVANLSAQGPVLGRARAYEALNAFASFALFSAKNTLPPRQAAALDAQMIDFMRRLSG